MKQKQRKTLLALSLCTLTATSWATEFVAMSYGQKYAPAEVDRFITQQFRDKFPANKYEVFMHTSASQPNAGMVLCSSTVGVAPLGRFEHPQHSYEVMGYQSVQGQMTDSIIKAYGLECLSRALGKMMADAPGSVFVPAGR